jgi:hypothetical protein
MQARVPRKFEPFSDFALETYVCGDATPEQAQAIERAAATSPELQRYLTQRRAERATFVLQSSRPRQAPRPLWALSLAWSGAFALAFVALLAVTVPESEVLSEVVRTKGGPSAELIVQRDGRTFAHRQGVLLRPGDRVRLRLQTGAGGFLTVVARDPRGLTTLYDAVELSGGEPFAPGSWVLDDSSADETWFVSVSHEPVRAADLREALRQGRAVTEPLAVLLLKREPLP